MKWGGSGPARTCASAIVALLEVPVVGTFRPAWLGPAGGSGTAKQFMIEGLRLSRCGSEPARACASAIVALLEVPVVGTFTFGCWLGSAKEDAEVQQSNLG